MVKDFYTGRLYADLGLAPFRVVHGQRIHFLEISGPYLPWKALCGAHHDWDPGGARRTPPRP